MKCEQNPESFVGHIKKCEGIPPRFQHQALETRLSQKEEGRGLPLLNTGKKGLRGGIHSRKSRRHHKVSG